MKPKHSPGPWHTKTGERAQGAIGAYLSSGLLVAVARYSQNPEISPEAARANAQLIAAAPDLLEACRAASVLAWSDPKNKDLAILIEAAIERATVNDHTSR
jgi:hypothetical protein